MRIDMSVEGHEDTGKYKVECSCGTTWLGRGEQVTLGFYSPALPVAEAIVHVRMNHFEGDADLRFSDGFELWLQQYWERSSLSNAPPAVRNG